jgi:hypothetical protein
MKTLPEIVAELQALDTTVLDSLVAGLNQAITDLQAFVVSAVDPVVSVTTTTASGVTATFVPSPASDSNA